MKNKYRKLLSDGTYEWYNGNYIITPEWVISNPTVEMLLENGYEEYIPESVTPTEPTYTPKTEPYSREVIDALKSMVLPQIEQLSDEEAVKVTALFPTWNSKMGEFVETGTRLYYDENLYKVIQAHTIQEEWTPSVSVSLFTNVSAELNSEEGTLDNPISWVSGMECFSDKYYKENEITYKCTRDSGVGLYYSIVDLLGTYFETV